MQLANQRQKLRNLFGVRRPERVADGVWLVRGSAPLKTMNVYLIEDGDGVTMFDAGVASMADGLRRTTVEMGGLKRIVLGHAHPDHRGAAPALGGETLVHADDRADAEGDGGRHYFHYERLNPLGRFALPRLMEQWDNGPVEITGTVAEGDEIAGFEVVHLPGHAPGLIALWRPSDRLALVSDAFYTVDPQTGIKGKPRVAHAAFTQNTEQARASLRKLAALDPAAAWPGHADPVTGDVRTQLERAAETT